MARVLSDELHKRVVIVDTSNEIGGDGDVPHPAIGGARRMQVPDPSQQHKVMVALMHISIYAHTWHDVSASVGTSNSWSAQSHNRAQHQRLYSLTTHNTPVDADAHCPSYIHFDTVTCGFIVTVLANLS